MNKSKEIIPQIEPWIDYSELAKLKKAIKSSFLTESSLTEEFENLTKVLTGVKHAIAMSNGTVALFCAMKALNIGPGDEVIVPDMTFIASANSVIMAGARPVFCDVREDTFCIDIDAAEKHLSKNTKAIMPVHLYGQSADMDRVKAFSKENNLKIIEDAAQGIGVKFNGQHAGTFGDIGVLSYYGNKTITCGEGGMVLTDDDKLARTCSRLKNHGRDRKGIFVHDYIGFNFCFTELQAAVGIAQMEKLPEIIEKKKKLRERYVAELSDLPRFKPTYVDPRTTPVFWFASFLSEDTNEISQYLLKRGIQIRRFFYPLHLQPCYKKSNLVRKLNNRNYRVSERIYNRGISLPSSATLTKNDQEKVIKAIKSFYENRF